MAVVLIIVAIILIIILAAYVHQKIKLRYWARKGVPYDEPHIIFGNVKKVITLEHGIFEFLDEQYRNHESLPFVGCYAFSKPILIIRDLDLIKDITTKDFSSFVNRSFYPDISVDPMAGRVMFGRRDDEWRAIRQKMAMAFSNAKLRKMFPNLKESAEELTQKFKAQSEAGEGTVEITSLSMRYAVDTITAVAFGSRGNALREFPRDSFMFELLGKILSFDFYQGVANNLIFFARPLYVMAGKLGLPFHVFPKSLDDTILKIVDVALHERLQEKERKSDIFDIIAWSEEPELQGLQNKAAAAVQMLIAGSETSAVTSAFALYELAKRPAIQDRLRKEIFDTLNKNNGVVTFDAVSDMEYLDKVVKETMRLWPILPFIDRICQKPYRLSGTDVVIEKGTQIFIPMSSIQRDPQYFPDPEKFDPERFSSENIGSIPEFAYIPFGAGPRFCVGKRFGLLNVKTALVHFIKNYEVRPTNETFKEPEWNKQALTLNLKNGLILSVKPLT